MRGRIRRREPDQQRDGNSLGKVQNVRGDSSVRIHGATRHRSDADRRPSWSLCPNRWSRKQTLTIHGLPERLGPQTSRNAQPSGPGAGLERPEDVRRAGRLCRNPPMRIGHRSVGRHVSRPRYLPRAMGLLTARSVVPTGHGRVRVDPRAVRPFTPFFSFTRLGTDPDRILFKDGQGRSLAHDFLAAEIRSAR